MLDYHSKRSGKIDCIKGVCRTFSSPTILVDNDIIIFGGPRQSRLEKEPSELAYLKNIPNKKELRALLEWIEV